mgnify:CR=1 FL=1
MNIIDKIIAPFAPSAALERVKARAMLRHINNAYEAAKPTRTRKNKGDNRSGTSVAGEAQTLRGQARHLEQNHDLAAGVLNTLVTRVVGPKGISVEPLPRDKEGKIQQELAKEISRKYKRWLLSPETTGEVNGAMMDQLLCRSWFRDGEVFAKDAMGTIPGLIHGTAVPYSVELLEADYCPDSHDDSGKNIRQGIQRNAWGRATYYWLHKTHPGDELGYRFELKPVNADLMHHLKLVDRLHQNRGVSVFASVMGRLNDIKDYEDSERVAARIAANMAFYIKKGMPDMYPADEDDESDRELVLENGIIFDDLLPGEDVGTIQSNRPSQLLEGFRNAMMRAVAAGTRTNYSAVSKNYNGTYSAQRQELVESWDDYGLLSGWYIHCITRPIYEKWLRLAIVSGQITLPKTLDKESLYDAAYQGPSMPWIDPQKEAKGHEASISNRTKSPQEIIRSRGANPMDVLDQLQQWDDELDKRGLKAAVEGVEPEEVSPPEDPVDQ